MRRDTIESGPSTTKPNRVGDARLWPHGLQSSQPFLHPSHSRHSQRAMDLLQPIFEEDRDKTVPVPLIDVHNSEDANTLLPIFFGDNSSRLSFHSNYSRASRLEGVDDAVVSASPKPIDPNLLISSSRLTSLPTTTGKRCFQIVSVSSLLLPQPPEPARLAESPPDLSHHYVQASRTNSRFTRSAAQCTFHYPIYAIKSSIIIHCARPP
jgi:hypothetical protein